jgi:hypothetical protein
MLCKLRFFIGGWLAIACLTGPGACVISAAEANRAELDGQSLALELCQQQPSEPLQTKATLKFRDENGASRTVPVKFQTRIEALSWQAFYEAVQVAEGSLQRLQVHHQTRGANEYFWAEGTQNQAPRSTNRISGDALFTPFGATDFWVADLGLDFFHWPNQLLRQKEMRVSRFCLVLESRPAVASQTGYSRVLSWIDQESRNPLRAEAYGPDGQLLKVFTIGHLKRINGRLQLKEMDIRNLKTGSRTRLEFDLKVD